MEDRRNPALMPGGGKRLSFSVLHNIQNGVVDQPDSYLRGTGRLPRDKVNWGEADRSPILEPKLRLNGVVLPLLHIPLWRIHVLL